MKFLKRFCKSLVWLIAFGLVMWVFRATPLSEIWAVLQTLTLWQILIILIVNSGILFMFGLRWWLILKAQGYPIPYLAIMRYRLASFGVSYFTPGPQFGGEPLQVYYLKEYHSVPTEIGVAAIALDKLFELLANLTFLVFGISVLLNTELAGGWMKDNSLFISLGLLVPPIVFLGLLGKGVLPISSIGGKVLGAISGWERFGKSVHAAETEMSQFLRNSPNVIGTVLVASGLVWGALIFEYWLMIKFLGLALTITQVIIIITAARIAFLTPLPGALGALEASQIAAMQVLGFPLVVGVSLALLIRTRDVIFGMIGLIWGGILTKKF
ncbi:MAG: flippase-like domain-containing protein [Chloroflexota bacterium]